MRKAKTAHSSSVPFLAVGTVWFICLGLRRLNIFLNRSFIDAVSRSASPEPASRCQSPASSPSQHLIIMSSDAGFNMLVLEIPFVVSRSNRSSSRLSDSKHPSPSRAGSCTMPKCQRVCCSKIRRGPSQGLCKVTFRTLSS